MTWNVLSQVPWPWLGWSLLSGSVEISLDFFWLAGGHSKRLGIDLATSRTSFCNSPFLDLLRPAYALNFMEWFCYFSAEHIAREAECLKDFARVGLLENPAANDGLACSERSLSASLGANGFNSGV